MLRSRSMLGAALLSLMVAPMVQAAPMVSVDPGVPGAMAVGGPTNQILAVSWTQASTFTDVIIQALIYSANPNFDEGTAWLTQSIGPGTQPGSEFAQSAVTFPSFGAPTTLFSGVTLGPGTWYLILSSPVKTIDMGWWNGNGAPVTGAGVTMGATMLTAGQFANWAYAPGSNFIGTYPSLSFSVTGNEVPTAVPEPASLMLIGCGLLTLVRVASRRKRQ